MIVKGQDVDNIYLGDTLADDGFRTKTFDFLLANPPFGVAWNTQQKTVTDEYEQRGFAGRGGRVELKVHRPDHIRANR
jgi:type I restriction enzyme M protein